MDEKPNQIVEQIEAQRDRLGRNLQELEDRVRSTTDWRTHFEKRPLLFMGAALGGGVLLGSMVTGRSTSRKGYSRKWSVPTSTSASTTSGTSSSAGFTGQSAYSSSRKGMSSPGTAYQKSKAWETIDNVRGALIGLASTKLKDFLAEAFPGFNDHFEETARSRSGSSTGSMSGSSGSYSGATPGAYSGGGSMTDYSGATPGSTGSGSTGSGAMGSMGSTSPSTPSPAIP